MPTPVEKPAKVLARIIDSSKPRRILCCGSLAEQVAEQWAEGQADAAWWRVQPAEPMADIAAQADCDLALVTGGLNGLDHAHGEQLLGSLRNYGTHRIAVLVEEQGDWSFTDFIALGFRRHAHLPEEGLTLYSYNLDSYNHERPWNNPRHWANPQMWGKSWW